jgi:hypothetical protein
VAQRVEISPLMVCSEGGCLMYRWGSSACYLLWSLPPVGRDWCLRDMYFLPALRLKYFTLVYFASVFGLRSYVVSKAPCELQGSLLWTVFRPRGTFFSCV